MKWQNSFYKGFSLVEITIVLGMFALIAALTVPISFRQLERNNAQYTARDLASNLFVMQQNAYNGKDTGEYGMVFDTTTYTLYEGTSSVTTNWSDSVVIGNGVRVTSVSLSDSGNEVHFTNGSQFPDTYGTVTVTDGNNSYIIEINSQGMIDVYPES